MAVRHFFLFGMIHRSGSNFLQRLLCLHPDILPVKTIAEDFLVANSDKLQQFVAGVTGNWNKDWDSDGSSAAFLKNSLAQACLDFLWREAAKDAPLRPESVLLTKTPSSRNLASISMFPDARAVVVVRDGRAAIASGMRSFNWNLEQKCSDWASRGEELLRVCEENPLIIVVHYEKLLTHPRPELERILNFIGRDAKDISDEAIASVPIIGSSQLLDTPDGKIHWDDVSEIDHFRPLERWQDWGADQHRIFNSIAGNTAKKLGYALVE